MAQVLKIDEIAPDTYSLEVKFDNGTVHATVCQCVRAKIGDETIECFDFTSDDFKKRSAMGEIDPRDVTRAVARFRAGIT